ncbi:MAG TPA: hypothetical protein QGI39_07325 [Gammaproteobacteria bacterium]|nr:hypothetical protein [Gammaproteobacteria bacterium]
MRQQIRQQKLTPEYDVVCDLAAKIQLDAATRKEISRQSAELVCTSSNHPGQS